MGLQPPPEDRRWAGIPLLKLTAEEEARLERLLASDPATKKSP